MAALSLHPSQDPLHGLDQAVPDELLTSSPSMVAVSLRRAPAMVRSGAVCLGLPALLREHDDALALQKGLNINERSQDAIPCAGERQISPSPTHEHNDLNGTLGGRKNPPTWGSSQGMGLVSNW